MTQKMRRYNLALPQELFDHIQFIADERGTTVIEIMRRFIQLGLIVVAVEAAPGSALIIRSDEGDKEIVLI